MLLELGAKTGALPLMFATLIVRVAPGPCGFALEGLTVISAISEFYGNLIWAQFYILLDPKVKGQKSEFVVVWKAAMLATVPPMFVFIWEFENTAL